MEKETLMTQAKLAMQKAYAPYSHFQVGAALLGADGKVYTGCNVENASFSPTICAERVAFTKAVSEGCREFVALAICGGKEGVIGGICTPCGVCRQVITEFCKPDFPIYLTDESGVVETKTRAQLLPMGFGPHNL